MSNFRLAILRYFLLLILGLVDTSTRDLDFVFKPWYVPNTNIKIRGAHVGEVINIGCQTNKENVSVVLEIEVSSSRYENAMIERKGRLKQNGQSFLLLVSKSDNGLYRCAATDGRKNITEELGALRVIPTPKDVIPVLSPTEKPFVLEVTGTRNLTCTSEVFDDRSTRYLTWFKQEHGKNRKISRSQLHYFWFKKGGIPYEGVILMFKNASIKTAGSYVCVRNFSSIISEIKIQVEIEAIKSPEAKLVHTPSLLTIREGEGNVSAKCNVSGSPKPMSRWIKDNELIKSCHNRKDPICALDMVFPVYPNFNGTFVCQASNLNGTAEVSFSLFIQVPVSLVKTPTEVYIPHNEMASIDCKVVRSNPLPIFRWEFQPNDCQNVKTCKPDPKKWRTIGRPVLINTAGNESQVSIPKSRNSNFYRCIANNTFSSDIYLISVRRIHSGPQISTNNLTESTVGILVACLVFVLVFSVSFIIWYKRRLKKKYAPYLAPNAKFRLDPSRSLFDQSSRLPYDMDWEFPRERLVLSRVLGAGVFGEVWLGEAQGILAFTARDKSNAAAKRRAKLKRTGKYSLLSSKKRRTKKREEIEQLQTKAQVAVKTLKENAGDSDYKDLASELKILIHLGEHKNIVNLLGACTQSGKLCLIMEFCCHGNLLAFLRDRREIFQPIWVKNYEDMERECTFTDLLSTSYEVAQGMSFLASKKCIHRDLAARNILLGEGFVVKIADFGLARDVYEGDIYMKSTGGLLPAKWMAPEALVDKIYAEQSDVWSFGILLWEIFTLGGSPYPGLPTEELLFFLQSGKRMERPEFCPYEIFTIMRKCWDKIPESRPLFCELVDALRAVQNIYAGRGNPYVNLNTRRNPEAEESECTAKSQMLATNNLDYSYPTNNMCYDYASNNVDQSYPGANMEYLQIIGARASRGEEIEIQEYPGAAQSPWENEDVAPPYANTGPDSYTRLDEGSLRVDISAKAFLV